MAMLPSTRAASDKLRAAGLARREYRITSYSNGWITVDFKCTDQRLLGLALPLAERMRVRLLHNGGQLVSLMVEAAEAPALLIAEFNDDRRVKVANLAEAEALAYRWHCEALARLQRREYALRQLARQR